MDMATLFVIRLFRNLYPGLTIRALATIALTLTCLTRRRLIGWGESPLLPLLYVSHFVTGP